MDELSQKLAKIFSFSPRKIILSKPSPAASYRKIVLEQKGRGYQIAQYTEKQVFHKNVESAEAEAFCQEEMKRFFQLNAWDEEAESILLLSKKGKVSLKRKKCSGSVPAVSTTHNRTKQYLLAEGTVIPPLVDMGVFTADGRVVHSMYDKFRQINRFVEMVNDAVDSMNPKQLNIIDFGCGKSYLTFILYYYFTEIRKIPVRMIGLDLKADVIEKCNATAQKYGYEGLSFELGDINGYSCPFDVDMVITLHACDTATDFALYNAIRWNAKMIFSVPCCQHELNHQMEPEHFAILSRYGIIQERFAALATDAIRANLLEASGYRTQLLEFVDFAHTPKNILIRAIRRNTSSSLRKKALDEVQNMMREFHFTPTLYNLLQKDSTPHIQQN
jgi:SAM-dependent methyltransferase